MTFEKQMVPKFYSMEFLLWSFTNARKVILKWASFDIKLTHIVKRVWISSQKRDLELEEIGIFPVYYQQMSISNTLSKVI